MALAPAFRAAIAVFRGRAEDLLPAYLLAPAVPAITRVVSLVGVLTVGLYLQVSGRIDRFLQNVEGRTLDAPNPNTEPEAFGQWVETVTPLFEPLLTPTTLGVLAVTLIATAVVFLVLSAATNAAQFAACWATLDDRRGTTAAIDGAARYWRPMLGLFLLEAGLWLVASAVAAGVVAVAFAASPPVAALAGVIVGPLWVFVVLAVRLVFAFAPVAVVVDDAGVGDALSGSLGFVRAVPVDAVGYALVSVAAVGTLGSMAAVSAEAGGAVGGVVNFLLLTPALGLTKTALYASHVDSISPPAIPDDAVRSQIAAALRRGLREMVAFVRDTPTLHALTLVVFASGFALGWTLVSPLDGVVTTSLAERLEGHFPPTAALFFGANNWTVAVGSAYSGVALAVPAAVSMAFNGAFFGILGHLEVAPAELLAFVVPHGLIELPALVVAGTLGISLGATTWRTYRGLCPETDSRTL